MDNTPVIRRNVTFRTDKSKLDGDLVWIPAERRLDLLRTLHTGHIQTVELTDPDAPFIPGVVFLKEYIHSVSPHIFDLNGLAKGLAEINVLVEVPNNSPNANKNKQKISQVRLYEDLGNHTVSDKSVARAIAIELGELFDAICKEEFEPKATKELIQTLFERSTQWSKDLDAATGSTVQKEKLYQQPWKIDS